MARKLPASFKQKFHPDDVLADFIGSGAVTRAEALKKFWKVVKSRGLQNCNDGRVIDADRDDCVKRIFGGKKKVKMTEVLSGLIKHLDE